MEIITAQTDNVGKISSWEAMCFFFFAVSKIMQICGESLGVKVKRSFVLSIIPSQVQ